MAWDSERPIAPSNPNPTQPSYNRDHVLQVWRQLLADLEAAKAAEKNLRNFILAHEFQNASRGTHNIDLGNGWKLKAVVKENLKLDKDQAKIDAVIEEISKAGNEGAFLVGRLISYEPKLNEKEYRELGDTYRRIIDKIVTITPAQSQLELVEPKS